jgi:hypothetical protein
MLFARALAAVLILVFIHPFAISSSFSQVRDQVVDSDCATNTGSSATLLLASPILQDSTLGDPSRIVEIRVYSEDGTCVGRAPWEGQDTSVSIWGDDPERPGKEGLGSEEQFLLGIVSEIREADSDEWSVRFTLDQREEYFAPTAKFESGAIYMVASMSSEAASNAASNERSPDDRPTSFELSMLPNYPNPASEFTMLAYTIPSASSVNVAAYDMLGRRISVIYAADSQEAGRHSVRWNTSSLASGAYVVRLKTTSGVREQVVTVIREG